MLKIERTVGTLFNCVIRPLNRKLISIRTEMSFNFLLSSVGEKKKKILEQTNGKFPRSVSYFIYTQTSVGVVDLSAKLLRNSPFRKGVYTVLPDEFQSDLECSQSLLVFCKPNFSENSSLSTFVFK